MDGSRSSGSGALGVLLQPNRQVNQDTSKQDY